MDDTPPLTAEFKVGVRIRLNRAAGPHLGGRQGIVIGSGRYRDSLRVTLDGSKTSMTLHKKYFDLDEEAS